MDRGAWRAMVLGVAKSQTQLSDFQKNTILFGKKKKKRTIEASIAGKIRLIN